MMLYEKVEILALFFTFWLCAGISDDVNDDDCVIGTCKAVIDCPTATSAFKRGERRHGLIRCGFMGSSEIVCCPDFPKTEKVSKEDLTSNITIWEKYAETTKAPTDNLRKSARACKKFMDTDYPAINFLILEGEIAQLGEFPHMVVIGYDDDENPGSIKWDCGGSLISEKIVVTAAHCIALPDGSVPIRVRTGFVDFNDDKVVAQEFDIRNYTAHPEYSRLRKIHDIALIELDRSINLSVNAFPACLYQSNDNPLNVTITGWGSIDLEGTRSSTLQKATITSVENSECEVLYQKFSKDITESHICAVSRNDSKDTCQGDSGGPLQVKTSDKSELYSIVGVTAYGLGCGGSVPAVYSRIYFYLDWIESIVWP